MGQDSQEMLRIAVTGTDTSVGKTVIATALVGLCRSRGLKTGVMKPIETGVSRGEPGSDHVLLATAADHDPDDPDICPVILEESLAPFVAAKSANVEIDLELLDKCFERISCDQDCVVVEGAGGLLVPIKRDFRYDHLFARWNLDIIIVASDRLGVINHTTLSVEAAQRAGLRVRGVVLNQVHRANPSTIVMNNGNSLRELLPAIPIVEFPCVEALHGIRRMQAFRDPLDLGLLRDVALGSGLANMLFENEGSREQNPGIVS